MNREPTTEEWFANWAALGAEAGAAIEKLRGKWQAHHEYAEQYEAAVEDVDHALRRGCNRLRTIARYANNQAETNNADHGRPDNRRADP